MSRQMDKTKIEICAKLGISTETFDAYINAVNGERNKNGQTNVS